MYAFPILTMPYAAIYSKRLKDKIPQINHNRIC